MLNTWFIRHGESEANAGGRTSDPAAIGLSNVGREQAELAATRFYKAPELIVTSPYARARQTAEPIIRKYPGARVEEWSVQEFTYLSPSRCKNTTTAERIPMVKEYWGRCDPFYCDGEGAESFERFVRRLRKTKEDILGRGNSFTAVFSHQQFIAGMLWLAQRGEKEMTKESMKDYFSFLAAHPIENAAIVEVYEKDK